MDQFEERLHKMQGNYAQAKTQQEQMFGGAAVDAGIYEARLSSAALAFSKKKGTLQIKRTHIITSAGNFEGVPVTDYMNLENEYGFVFARRWIEICGKECPEKAIDFKKVVDELSKSHATCRIEVRRDGDFTNVSVVELLSGEGKTSAEDKTPVEETPVEETPVENETLAALKAFASSQDIAFDDGLDVDGIKELISAYNYESGKLTAEERELLTSNDLGGLIQFPAKTPAKAPAKAPAKPAAAPAKKALPPKRK